MPDYELIEINESNFDVNCNNYVKEAYNKKKWAFINDYCRLKYLYDFGGIYLDADVEVLKPLDEFLHYRYFSGHETLDIPVCATMGSIAKNEYIKKLLDYYDDAETDFNIPNTQIITKITNDWIEKKDKGMTYLKNGGVIFPSETFCPYDHINFMTTETDNSYTKHLFLGSWIK